jgi:hypothetical protein
MHGTSRVLAHFRHDRNMPWEAFMNGIIYLIGLVVVVMAVLSLIGLR